ncbi:hypothetical protein SDC9_151461 [bioreactor metagenome]|uniref:Uncharacterized protein n=1 Tax=bioreactor metagenome TaxID=1076179 RepID=A0A645EQC8_9ZZZZ
MLRSLGLAGDFLTVSTGRTALGESVESGARDVRCARARLANLLCKLGLAGSVLSAAGSGGSSAETPPAVNGLPAEAASSDRNTASMGCSTQPWRFCIWVVIVNSSSFSGRRLPLRSMSLPMAILPTTGGVIINPWIMRFSRS